MSSDEIAEELRRRDRTAFYLTLMGCAYACTYCYVGWITNALNYDHVEHDCCIRNALLNQWRDFQKQRMRR